MAERAFAPKRSSSNRGWLQRKAPLRVGAADDRFEREADRVADAVTSGRSASRPGVSLSRVPVTRVQRDNGKPKSEEEKYKEAAKKLGEAFLATDIGKKLREKVEQDPLVKGAKEAGESFIGTLPGKVITGAAAVGAVSALAATHKELPAQIPEIPLDKITPGLKVKIIYEGPVDNPTKAMITFSYTEQIARGKKPAKTKSEIQREENARMAAEHARFRAGLRYAPGTPEAKRQEEEEEALKRAAFSGVGKLPEFGKLKTFPGLAPPPSYGFKLKPFSLLDEELKLKPIGEATGAQAEEKKKEEQGTPVQRKSADGAAAGAVPPVVNDVLDAAGEPLDAGTRRHMESHFGYDFAGVRVHTDARAAASARAISARAYTIGNDIVFSPGQFSPHTTRGRWMLAHELTHVLQQGAAEPLGSGPLRTPAHPALADAGAVRRSPDGVIQRGFFEWIDDLFGGTSFSHGELLVYLKALDEKKGPVGGLSGDNKARALVKQWKADATAFDLRKNEKVYLIQEMQLGFTGDDDEQAILDLLNGSDADELGYMFGAGGLTAARLDSDFHGAEEDRLHDFFARRFEGGFDALKRRQVRPRGEARLARESAGPIPATCDVAHPENCHSYEQWIALFAEIAPPHDPEKKKYEILGEEALAPKPTATDPTAGPEARRPFVRHSAREFLPHDRFIDGPTEQWVRAKLPPNLVETAYELPSDCADIAVILRHVWLVAHRRTELYRGWVCGTDLNDPRTREMRDLMRGGATHTGEIVWSSTVSRIVRPYRDPAGNVIRDFPTLQALLHPGDVLVWDHPAPRGGHTHTVMQIHRSGEQITRLDLLQGNEPIGEAEARNILIREYGFTDAQLPAGKQRTWPARARDLEKQLRTAPGRRIEIGHLVEPNLPQNDRGVWTIWGGSRLVAAGPPATSEQPAVRRGRAGRDKIRGLSDWQAELASAADLPILQSRVEAALLETRSLLEGGHAGLVSASDAMAFGRAAGRRLWALANESARTGMQQAEGRRSSAGIADADLLGAYLGEESHYRPLQHLARMMQQIGRDARVATVADLFATAAREFELAARGMTSIGFSRTARELSKGRVATGARLSRVLLTGFDPFEFNRRGQQIEPRQGRFNPSGAAILQLDGTTIPVDTNRGAAVEGVVLPVDYRAFNRGIIESQLGPQVANSDAVITVSEAPSRGPDQPLQVERFAVGVHKLNNGRLEAIPAAPGASSTGPAIIETGPATEEIVQQANRDVPEAERPLAEVGNTVTFRFATVAEANRALRALGLTQQAGSAEVEIDDVAAIRRIVATMKPGAQNTGIRFEAGTESFQAVVVSGPGGSFLSNEVSYRMLRMIAATGRTTTSFHVHTPGGGSIPQDVTGEEAARARARAQGRQRPTAAESSAAREAARRARFAALEIGRKVVRRVVDGLKALIRAVVRRLP
jgi:pyrrolidone-carboxylate peptidase